MLVRKIIQEMLASRFEAGKYLLHGVETKEDGTYGFVLEHDGSEGLTFLELQTISDLFRTTRINKKKKKG